jgi:glutamate carboxypeptidase
MHGFCESQLEWMLQETERLVCAESPSTDKPALDRCGAILADRLTAIGGRVERHPRADAGDHVRAEFGVGERQVLLLGHFDTVWPVGQIQRMPLRRDGDRLHGPGVFDTKGGLVIAMAAVRALDQARLARGLRRVLLCTSDEEIGSRSSRELIEAEARRSDAVLVLEPSLPGGAVKTSRKAVGEFTIDVRGVSAHAGIAPGQGASAIHELARQIVRVQQLEDPARGISVNVGVVSGGSRSNVVAEHARAAVDVRALSMMDARRLEQVIRGLSAQDSSTTVSVTGGFERPPLERTPAVVRLYEQAKEVARELGRRLDEGATGGGSDGSFTAAIGVPTLDGLGAHGDGAHAAHEHVIISDLPWRAALLAGLIERIANGGKIEL